MSDLKKMRETIGANIRAHREAHGMTQIHLAMSVGTDDAHVSHWERGTREPKLSTILKLCLALDCELEDLVGISPDWKGWLS